MAETEAPKIVKTKPRLFCFSHLRWNFVYQRPQHLMSRAAKIYDVVFIEEPLIEEHATAAFRDVIPCQGIRVVTPIVTFEQHEQERINLQLSIVSQLFYERDEPPIFWYYTPQAMKFTSNLRPDICVYDNMDELSNFAGSDPGLVQLEAELLRRATVVFTGGQSLFEAKKHRHSNIHPFPSGIDARHFAKMNRRGADPDDQAHIPFPRVGFFGVVDERLDIALVKELAHRLPNFQFIMIGPVAKIDSASLPQAPNIHWLGSKQYSDLPSYLHHWDVGFMPFALNDATRYISPTKTPEFLAAGLRVVSTPIIDVVRTYGGKELIEIAGNVEEFVVSLHHCINKENQDAWQSKADRHLATISWDLTWRLMQTLFLSSRSKQPGHSPRFYRSGEYVV